MSAEQSQSLANQDHSEKAKGLQRLASGKAILPWILALWPLVKSLFNSLNFASVVEFAAGLGGNPHVKTIWTFATSGVGTFLTMLLGLLWLAFLVTRKPKQVPPTKLESPAPEQIQGEQTAQLQVAPEKPKPKLEFEINELNSQVRVTTGPHAVRRIAAEIQLRCLKAPGSVMGVRAFHASLHRLQPNGETETTEIPQEGAQAITELPSLTNVQVGDGWTIADPITNYRYYRFFMDITPRLQASLSPDYFLRVTMEAVGQEPLSQNLYVEEWVVPEGNSAVSLRPFDHAEIAVRNEFRRLKAELGSAGERIHELEGQIEERDQAVEGRRAELSKLQGELNKARTDIETEKKLKAQLEKSYDLKTREAVEIRELWHCAQADRDKAETKFLDAVGQAQTLTKELKYQKESAEKSFDIYKENLARFDQHFDKWHDVIAHAQQQAMAINNWVPMKEVLPERLQLARTPRKVVIAIRILNESVYNITIPLKKIKGCLRFMGTPLGEDVTVPQNAAPIEDLEPRQPALIILEQPITQTQAETIEAAYQCSDPNGLFSLGDLEIPITVKKPVDEVTTRPLTIHPDFRELGIEVFRNTEKT